MTISLSVLKKKSKKKKVQKKVVLPEKKNGATGLKLGMQTQLDSANNVGVGPIWPHFFSLCVRLKISKMVLLKK